MWSSQSDATAVMPTHPAPPASSLPPSADKFAHALACNHAWAENSIATDPELLAACAKGQAPEILWIGCSDSRVPETTVCGLKPGDIFVHRNIANVLHAGDLNSAAVIEYAVVHLKVKHVVVCGHTSCGGVGAALGNQSVGLIDAWLLPVRKLRMRFSAALEKLAPAEKSRFLVDENVKDGVRTLREMASIIDASRERGLQVHGLVYDVATGQLQELDTQEEEAVVKAREECFTISGSH